ncbi:MAG: hypothetical protein SCK29_00855 [Bacillota bacterium]|nr:hypothetical protein [Bacillota bacterium]MDW7682649.1 hypothetical protein [Bacillota bacterium]
MSIPRHKRMKRRSRLQAALHWIPKYPGKNLVRGYARHFGVNLPCAIIELEMLGHKIKQSYKDNIYAHEEAKQKRTLARKQRQAESQGIYEEFLAPYTGYSDFESLDLEDDEVPF